MILDEFDELQAEFTAPYLIEVKVTGHDGQPVVRQRTVPGLLTQLYRATEPGRAGPTEGGSGSGYGSREPARLSAVSLLDEIRRRLAWWAHAYAGRAGTSPADSLRELHAVTYAMDRQAVTVLVADLNGWRTRARWILGWDTPPYAPHVPCPDCAGIATLRLWVQERFVACVLCGAWWDNEHLGQLRERMRLSRALTHASPR